MLSKIEELQLIGRCTLLDDRAAFGRLVEAYQADVRRFFIHLTGDPALSDDLAQETFLKAYTSVRGFKGLSRFRTWLFRIAYNEFYDHVRRNREEPLPDDAPQQLPADGFEQQSGARMDAATALRRLGEPERTIAVLYFIDDRPMKEVAAIMGMPGGTVKSHISRARAKLAAFLKQ